MAETTMPAKRKFSCIDSNAPPEKITPPAPRKQGKLKSILKRPSPPSRFMASTPSAQIKLEFHAAAHSFRADMSTSAAPATVKRVPNLEVVSGADDTSTASCHMPPASADLILIEDSAAETDLPVSPPRKSKSPKYEDDGDTEHLITDSQPQTVHSDETLLMSGGLGPGESPYKRAVASEMEQWHTLGTVDTTAPKREPCEGTEARPDRCLSDGVNPDELSKLEHQDTPTLPVCDASAPAAAPRALVPANSEASRAARRKASDQRQASLLAHVSQMLQEYEESRKIEVKSLQDELLSAQSRVCHLETQLSLLQNEFVLRAKDRQLQHSWNLNQYAIFSRRTHSLHGLEETKVVGGCDDLREANAIARGIFKGEMNRLESRNVEDLGQVNTFIDVEEDGGLPTVQMRSTPCGMVKCRSHHLDSRWDLTVERVASRCT